MLTGLISNHNRDNTIKKQQETHLWIQENGPRLNGQYPECKFVKLREYLRTVTEMREKHGKILVITQLNYSKQTTSGQ